MGIDGILNVNKPAGQTSFSVVAWLKRVSGEKRLGHAGTLDPIATGVLPVCFGQATRVTEFIAESSKTYSAEIRLGAVTDTFDCEGRIVQIGDASGITVEEIEQALVYFRGTIQQIPPAYSALKHRGKPYYELARQGLNVTPRPRQVTIFDIKLTSYNHPFVTLEVECSKGTYIRSLAHDLGQRLGCGAFLNSLTRLRYGPFSIEDAITLAQFQCAYHQGTWIQLLHPIDSPLLHWKAVILDRESERIVRNGNALTLPVEIGSIDKRCRAYNLDGYLVALLCFVAEKGQWHPIKVFSPPEVSIEF